MKYYIDRLAQTQTIANKPRLQKFLWRLRACSSKGITQTKQTIQGRRDSHRNRPLFSLLRERDSFSSSQMKEGAFLIFLGGIAAKIVKWLNS